MSGNIATEVDWSWVMHLRKTGKPRHMHDVMKIGDRRLVIYLGRLPMEGFEGCEDDNVYEREVYALITKDGTMFIDVRGPGESYLLGHIREACLGPMPLPVLYAARMVCADMIEGDTIYVRHKVGPNFKDIFTEAPAPTGPFSWFKRRKLKREGFEEVKVYPAKGGVRYGQEGGSGYVTIVYGGKAHVLPSPDIMREYLLQQLHDLASDMQYEAKAPYAEG